MPVWLIIRSISGTKSLSRKWLGEILTATRFTANPICFQHATCLQAVVNTHSVSGLIMPIRSAIAINSAADTWPNCGWYQRDNVSMPITLPVSIPTWTWSTRLSGQPVSSFSRATRAQGLWLFSAEQAASVKQILGKDLFRVGHNWELTADGIYYQHDYARHHQFITLI